MQAVHHKPSSNAWLFLNPQPMHARRWLAGCAVARGARAANWPRGCGNAVGATASSRTRSVGRATNTAARLVGDGWSSEVCRGGRDRKVAAWIPCGFRSLHGDAPAIWSQMSNTLFHPLFSGTSRTTVYFILCSLFFSQTWTTNINPEPRTSEPRITAGKCESVTARGPSRGQIGARCRGKNQRIRPRRGGRHNSHWRGRARGDAGHGGTPLCTSAVL